MFSRRGRKEAPDGLKLEYIDISREYGPALARAHKEMVRIGIELPSEEKTDEKYEELRAEVYSEDLKSLHSRYEVIIKQLEQYDPPEGYRTWYEWMKIQIDTGGSPIRLLSFMVQNGHYEDNPASRDAIKREFGDTTIYYETASLKMVGLLNSIPDPKDRRKRLYFLTKRLTSEQVEVIGEAVPELGKKTITDLPDEEITQIAQRVDSQLRVAASVPTTLSSEITLKPVLFDGRTLFEGDVLIEDRLVKVEELISSLRSNEGLIIFITTDDQEEIIKNHAMLSQYEFATCVYNSLLLEVREDFNLIIKNRTFQMEGYLRDLTDYQRAKRYLMQK